MKCCSSLKTTTSQKYRHSNGYALAQESVRQHKVEYLGYYLSILRIKYQ